MAAFGATVIRAGRRFLSSLPALFGVLVFTFLLMRVLPGDPAVFFASGPNAGKEEIEVIRKQMGLNKPVPEQLMLYLYDVGSGNLGRSMMTGQAVAKDLKERLPASLELTLTALLIALVSAVPLGVLAALRPGSLVDHGVRLFCSLGVCVPTFVSGLLLIYVFYYLLGFAPDPTGRIDIFATLPPSRTGFLIIDFLLAGDLDGWWAAARQLMLPALTMALFVIAPLARITRASMLVSLRSEEHTSELQSHLNLVCRLLLEKKNVQYRACIFPAGGYERAPGGLLAGGRSDRRRAAWLRRVAQLPQARHGDRD